jgi:hypothetical protein
MCDVRNTEASGGLAAGGCRLPRCASLTERLLAPAQVHVRLLAADASAPVPSTRNLAVRPASSPAVLGAHSAYFTGAVVFLEVWATRACHIYVVNQSSTGVLVPILPSNSQQTGADARLRAPGERRRVPDPAAGDSFKLEFSTCGTGRLFVFATEQPWQGWTAEPEELRRSLTRKLHIRPQAEGGVDMAVACVTFDVLPLA